MLICLFASCSTSPKFDREVWIENPDVNDQYNPRAKMVQDVIDNHLKIGMSRRSVLVLLGKPLQEGIEQRLPDSTIVPDSVSFDNPENLKPENKDRVLLEINKFYKSHSKPVMLIRYAVGWSLIDPNYLVIRLNNKGMVEAFWKEQG